MLFKHFTQVNSDYEQVGSSNDDTADSIENIYENITEEPMYENIYEKVIKNILMFFIFLGASHSMTTFPGCADYDSHPYHLVTVCFCCHSTASRTLLQISHFVMFENLIMLIILDILNICCPTFACVRRGHIYNSISSPYPFLERGKVSLCSHVNCDALRQVAHTIRQSLYQHRKLRNYLMSPTLGVPSVVEECV